MTPTSPDQARRQVQTERPPRDVLTNGVFCVCFVNLAFCQMLCRPSSLRRRGRQPVPVPLLLESPRSLGAPKLRIRSRRQQRPAAPPAKLARREARLLPSRCQTALRIRCRWQPPLGWTYYHKSRPRAPSARCRAGYVMCSTVGRREMREVAVEPRDACWWGGYAEMGSRVVRFFSPFPHGIRPVRARAEMREALASGQRAYRVLDS